MTPESDRAYPPPSETRQPTLPFWHQSSAAYYSCYTALDTKFLSLRSPTMKIRSCHRIWPGKSAAPAGNSGNLLLEPGSRPWAKSEGGIMMVGTIQDGQPARSRPRLSCVALIVALLAALAGGSRSF